MTEAALMKLVPQVSTCRNLLMPQGAVNGSRKSAPPETRGPPLRTVVFAMVGALLYRRELLQGLSEALGFLSHLWAGARDNLKVNQAVRPGSSHPHWPTHGEQCVWKDWST